MSLNMKPTIELAKHLFEAASDHAGALGENQPPDWADLRVAEREIFTEGLRPVLAVVDNEWRTALATILDKTANDPTVNIRDELVALIEKERN